MTGKEALLHNCWSFPEFVVDEFGNPVPSAIPFLLGDLHLEPEDEAALVASLKTLTDLETAVAPLPYKGLEDERVGEPDGEDKKGGKKK